MLAIDYLWFMWHKYYFLCNYLFTLFNPFRGISIISFDVLFNFKFVGYIYILLPNLNSDNVVMSRENLKLQFGIRTVCSEDPRT